MGRVKTFEEAHPLVGFLLIAYACEAQLPIAAPAIDGSPARRLDE
jgi:hypothetical protein